MKSQGAKLLEKNWIAIINTIPVVINRSGCYNKNHIYDSNIVEESLNHDYLVIQIIDIR